MIARCSTCGKDFEVQTTGEHYCPHCGTHVYISEPGGGEGTGGYGPHEGYGGAPPPPDYSYGGPEHPPSPDGPDGDGNPFDKRSEKGFVQAFLETAKLSSFDPGKLFRGMRVERPEGAFLFGWLCLTIGWLASNLWNQLAQMATPRTTPSDLKDLPPEIADLLERVLEGYSSSAELLAMIVLVPMMAAISLLVLAALVHLGVIIVGANNRGWNASFMATCYGMAPALAGIIPICGGPIGAIWSAVVVIIGVQALQRTSGAKAAFAVFLWVLLCCCCVCVGGAGLVSVIGQGLGALGG